MLPQPFSGNLLATKFTAETCSETRQSYEKCRKSNVLTSRLICFRNVIFPDMLFLSTIWQILQKE